MDRIRASSATDAQTSASIPVPGTLPRPCRRGTPDFGPQPRRQFQNRERLRDVVVGARIQRFDLVGLPVANREHQNLAAWIVLPNSPACLDSTDSGHVYIDENRI